MTMTDQSPASPPNPQRGVKVRAYADTLRSELKSSPSMRKGERTRLRLRIAAAEALEKSGYQDLKVADICKLAGVSLGTFYIYFTDKEDISVGIAMDFVTHLYDEARRASNGLGDWQAVYETNLFFVKAYGANPGLMRSHVQLQSLEPAFREVWEPLHQEWLNRLARSIRRRSPEDLSPEDALRMALALEQMVFSYIYNAVVTQAFPVKTDESDPEKLAKMLTQLWFRAIHARDPSPAEMAGT